MRAQFPGLLFELFERQPPDECGVVEKAVLVAAEEVAGDGAAGRRLVGRDANKLAEPRAERGRTLG